MSCNKITFLYFSFFVVFNFLSSPIKIYINLLTQRIKNISKQIPDKLKLLITQPFIQIIRDMNLLSSEIYSKRISKHTATLNIQDVITWHKSTIVGFRKQHLSQSIVIKNCLKNKFSDASAIQKNVTVFFSYLSVESYFSVDHVAVNCAQVHKATKAHC